MDMISVYNLKLKALLEKLLESQLQLKDDRNINILLSYLSELGEALLNLPILVEWVQKAVEYWESLNNPALPVVLSFTFNLTALLVKCEYRFYLFSSKDYILRLCNILKSTVPLPPSNKLAYIKLLISLTSHKPGLNWLITSQFWKDGVNFCFTSETVYVQKEAYTFVYCLLKNSTEACDHFCSIVIKQILSQLIKPSNQNLNCINDLSAVQEIIHILKLVTFILQSFIKDKTFTPQRLKLPAIFIKDINLEQIICNLMLTLREPEFYHELASLMLVLNHLSLIIENQIDSIPTTELRKLYVKNLQLLTDHMNTCSVDQFLVMCHNGELYWNVLRPHLPKLDDIKANKCDMSMLYLIIHSVPLYSLAITSCSKSIIEEEDEIKELFYEEVIASMCESTLRTVYKIRDKCIKDEDQLFYICYKCLLNVERCQIFYDKPEATSIFRCVCHSYKDIIVSLKDKSGLVSKFMNRENFLCTIMNVITKFVTNFDITWTDAFEIVCLIDACLDYLNFMNWSPKIALGSLKMLRILISKGMTPSMVLLSDQAYETPLATVPVILYNKLHDPNWEIRDTSLEVLHTLAIIAQDKFPSFQNIIMSSNVTSLLIIICTGDGESYVRASALKCLQELAKIQQIWTKILVNENLPNKVVEIFENETEAIVRSEAATLMEVIYHYHTIQSELLHQVYTVMYYAATMDLHWEVQVKALGFWQTLIFKQLVNQGMIDGTFPSVTFSKENRKIVTLTEKEIQSRLIKVLHYLSKCGCLAVLLNAMHESSDLAVNKKAVKVTKKLLEVLRNHSIIPSSTIKCDSPSSPVCSLNNDIFEVKLNSPTSFANCSLLSDNVINQIVSSHDSSLLSNVYVCDSSKALTSSNVVKQEIKVVPPFEFLEFTKRDLDLLIVERQQWLNKLNDLTSLLDDMLKNYGDFNYVNEMDCY
ncbi:uncharacterized protein LOC108742240 isoform X2 [Agrilus planipennis]|uniref:Uncharacterized protein LOC108742240 isoform X2 n=1 Tax=Agrilus planipennis TaxID=224129 RepID=A0A1W4XKH1_AGRPL|nr:uncharacterized protein LOC108742240 isoform X2 [Agrilus planipennis]